MKTCIAWVLLFSLICGFNIGHAQSLTPEQAAELAKKIRSMTPAEIIKYRDQLMKQTKQQLAKGLPNGDQLLATHHYDTTYTTVVFNYTKKRVINNSISQGTEMEVCYGKSMKAPMIYEANGHTIVQCALNKPSGEGSTDKMDQTAKAINKSMPYITPGSPVTQQNNLARQLSFGSMTLKDNSLTGSVSETADYSGPNNSTRITTISPVAMIQFSFMYDPLQHLSTVAAGGNVRVHTHKENHGAVTDEDSDGGASFGGSTSPANSTIAGVEAGQLPVDPNANYITVVKTPHGFKVSFNKTYHDNATGSDVTETFTAVIGEPQQEFIAMIKPMPDSKYTTWLPKGPKVDGSNDKKGDDSARFYVVVRDKNDTTKAYPGSFTVKYQLKDVTNYKGFNSNYPLTGGNNDNDFKISELVKSSPMFNPASITTTTASSKTNKGAGAIVQLTCMDYGAWARLTADVQLDNGTELTACPYYDRTDSAITVPFDVDKNKIADAWEKHENILNQHYPLNWDEDVRPDNHHNGDNIPLIDEYRGFLTEDDDYKPVYKRLSPQVKELFTIGLADASAYGSIYKAAIKFGAMSYTKVTKVQVYHLTAAKYGQHEPGEPSGLTYGRWINYNSPTSTHTCAVVIYADDNPNPDQSDESKTALATTFPVFDYNRAGYLGGQPPQDTKEVHLWGDYIVKKVPYQPTEYLPARPQGNDEPNQRMNRNIREANAEFRVDIDTAHASQRVAQYYYVNIARIISFTVMHELCHATGIHHHHVMEVINDKEGKKGDYPYYYGASNCPLRYWMDNKMAENCRTWVQMFVLGLWNAGDGTTPHGDKMALCTTGDDCFDQLSLKK